MNRPTYNNGERLRYVDRASSLIVTVARAETQQDRESYILRVERVLAHTGHSRKPEVGHTFAFGIDRNEMPHLIEGALSRL
jgi:hypothetical protein